MSSADFKFETTGDQVVHSFPEKVKDRIWNLTTYASVVITGPGQGGIGAETAKALSRASPRDLILVSRSARSVQPVIDEINATNPAVSTTFVQCNLASQESVRQATHRILSLVPHIDVLINNAATPPGPYSQTEDGIELQFGTNHIGHFLLTNLLLPKILVSGPGSRIVVLSSSAHRYASTCLDHYLSDGKTYTPWLGYIQSKAANVLFAKELSRMLRPHGTQVFAVHPGSIDTGISSQVSPEAMGQAIIQRGAAVGRARRKTLAQGCATTLVAALQPSLETSSGAYLVDAQISPEEPSALVGDARNAEALWQLSEQLVGQNYDWTNM